MLQPSPATSSVFRRRTDHEHKVDRVIRQLRTLPRDRPLSVLKKAVSHQVPKNGDRRRTDAKVDLRELDAILEIDPIARTCTAEPGVTFVDLVKATLEHGLVPFVVPELKTITVGGAVSGSSLESMSFRHGGFHDSCFEYEVITTDGRVLRCRRDNEHAHVFEMMHGSFGTLGFLSLVRFRLTPAKRHVRTRYLTYPTLDDYVAAIREVAREPEATSGVAFMDGIIHSPDRLVLSLGELVDDAPYTHSYDWVTVYYRTTATRAEDYLETPDYFFRYDRGVTNPTPRSFLGRLLFGKVLDSTRLLWLADRFPWVLSRDRPDVTLDVFVPLSKLPELLAWYRAAIGYFPLWCVPYRRPRPDYPWIAEGYLDGVDDDLFVDIAIYGLEQPPGRNYYAEIERELLAVRGIKTLISHNFYDEETFWTIWSRPAHEAAKRVVDPERRLRDLYTKTCRAARGL